MYAYYKRLEDENQVVKPMSSKDHMCVTNHDTIDTLTHYFSNGTAKIVYILYTIYTIYLYKNYISIYLLFITCLLLFFYLLCLLLFIVFLI